MQIHCSPEFIRRDRETEEECNSDKNREMAMRDGEIQKSGGKNLLMKKLRMDVIKITVKST